jgi:hypothetical protein
MLKNNLIFINVIDNFYGFLDTGGGMTFLFRKPELSSELHLKYIEEKSLLYFPKKVIVFYGNDYFKNTIYLFDYIHQKFQFIHKIPSYVKEYKMFTKKLNYSHIEILFEGKNELFLFDTGAATQRNNIGYGISFLDGNVFDQLKNKNTNKNTYKIIENYDDDGSPCIIIPEIEIFNTILKNVKFLRREKNAFYDFMTGQTGIKHIGAIGGNVLKHFKIICDYKNKVIYV